jgi:uncharacterized membrane protein
VGNVTDPDELIPRGVKRAAAGSLLDCAVMHRQTRGSFIPLAILAATSGARTWSGIAAISRRTPTKLFAAGEFIYDKVPTVPSRLAPPLLAGRIAAGAFVGATVGRRTGRNRAGSAILGGLVAYASAHATHRMRRALARRLPPMAAAFLEDALVAGAALAGAELLRRRDY